MLTDTHIIQRQGGYEVLARRQVITWPTGCSIDLHRVRSYGYDDLFLRAVRHDELHWVVFDLRDLTPPSFEADVKAQPRHDLDGMVLYSLRLGYGTSAEFLSKALANFRAAWLSVDHEVTHVAA